MKSTRNIGFVWRLGLYTSIALAAVSLPGIASADELMLPEITVVAPAIDTDRVKQRATESSIDDALRQVREQIRVDTDAHLEETISVPEPPKPERIAKNN